MNADSVPHSPPLPPCQEERRSLASPAEEANAPGGFAGWLLAAFVCALAFLLAATPARNSDLWLHLAAGRALVENGTPWGSEPFSSTTEGVYWVNSTWLSDVFFYELFRFDDGRALVVAKAVLVTLLAALLFAFRRRGTTRGLYFVVGSTAMPALGPWLALRPMLLSLLHSEQDSRPRRSSPVRERGRTISSWSAARPPSSRRGEPCLGAACLCGCPSLH